MGRNVQTKLYWHLKDQGMIANNRGMVSKGEIIRIFETYPLINGRRYNGWGGKKRKLDEIYQLLWNGKPPQRDGRKSSKHKRDKDFATSNKFLSSYQWRKLRYEAIQKYERRCMCCGLTPDDGIKLHVDHIKPRKKYPELALDIDNLQILCEICNHGKGNWDETDHRPIEDDIGAEHMRAIMQE